VRECLCGLCRFRDERFTVRPVFSVAAVIGSAASSSTDDSEPVNPEADAILARINRLYVASGFIHAFNALQYYWAWLPSGFRWHHRVMIPEYLNMIGAAMYMVSPPCQCKR
jgi:hypothetical protein